MENDIIKVEDDSTGLQKIEPRPLVKIPDDAPLMTRLAMMMENGVTINVDQMAKMQEMSERFEADEARKAFHVAMAEFKKNPPKVLKNKTVTYGTGDNETSYKHVTLASLATILDESLSKCDLSFTWKTEDLDKGLIKVTCILTHKLGHSESASMSSLPDGSGKKNPIQAKGSAISYLQRYTLKAVAGVAEEGQDDDGAAAGSGDKPAIIGIPEKEQWECIDLIIAELPADPPIDREKLARWFLATTHKYPSTKTRVIAAAEHVMQQSPQNIYVDANDNEQPGEFGTE